MSKNEQEVNKKPIESFQQWKPVGNTPPSAFDIYFNRDTPMQRTANFAGSTPGVTSCI